MNKYSDESRSLLHCKENYPLTENESRKIGEIIDKHSKNLMSKHKFLSVISASNVVSKHFGTKQHDKVTRPCIVLTVLVKGIIPLFEKPFPKELKGITVDVREGGFRFCQQNADEYQTNLRIGCKISSSTCPEKFGSLGGFIEHPQHGLCGITCAHVVLNDYDKYRLRESRTGTVEDSFNIGTIYQPVIRAGNEIGKIVKIVYKEGNESTHGVDLALFKIEKRAPIDGGFPDSQLTSFDAGLVWTKAGIPSDHNRVQKFGCVSGNTTGVIQFDNTVTREIKFDSLMTCDGESNLTTSLFKQYLIKTLHEDIKFCGVGDSGSLVLMKDDTGGDLDLRCIGMVVGLLDDESCVVTPIAPILDELKVYQLKQFTPNILKRISDKLDTVHDTFDRRFGELDNLVRGRQWCSIM
ncbi:uncharacterized protein LOC132731779 [Ruditapes philippinarum]|uniref:uncharacterized protein LOC132731779 n=1 Tax=Ruditapes philippinarum TaxID=129788 RepID=UPI00295B8948|nr:uncharacterized protein LOC132731779 [Ruditapes philippinarum]